MNEPTILALDTATRRATVAVSRGQTILAEANRDVTTHSEGLIFLIEEALGAAELNIQDIDAVACGRGPGSFTGLRIGMATAKGLCFAAKKPLVTVSSLYALAAVTAEQLVRGAAEPLDPFQLTPSIVQRAQTEQPKPPLTDEEMAWEDVRRKSCRYKHGPTTQQPENAYQPIRITVLLDARRSELFVATYAYEDGSVCPEAEEQALTIEVSIDQIRSMQQAEPAPLIILAGDGALLYGPRLLDELGSNVVLAPSGCHAIQARYHALVAHQKFIRGELDNVVQATPQYLRPPDARLPAENLNSVDT